MKLDKCIIYKKYFKQLIDIFLFKIQEMWFPLFFTLRYFYKYNFIQIYLL